MLRHYGRGVFGFELLGGFLAERLVKPLSIVKDVDVFEYALLGVFQVGILIVFRPLVLERPEESLSHRVIITVASATHRALDDKSLERLLIVVAGVLTGSITLV